MTSTTHPNGVGADPAALAAWSKRLQALPESARAQRVLELWKKAPPEDVTGLLHTAWRASGDKDVHAQHLALAAWAALQSVDDDDAELLRAAAAVSGHDIAYGLLSVVDDARSGRARQMVLPHPKSWAATGMPLGTRMAKARVATPKELETLLLDPAPEVHEVLAHHPRLQASHLLLAVRQAHVSDAVLDVVAQHRLARASDVTLALLQAPRLHALMAWRVVVFASHHQRRRAAAAESTSPGAREMLQLVTPT